jgi:hypothetical protein
VLAVGVSRHEVRRLGDERGRVTVAVEGDDAQPGGGRVCPPPARAGGDAPGEALLEIADETVADAVRVAGDEVRRRRDEPDVAAVARHGGPEAQAARAAAGGGSPAAGLTTARTHRDPGRDASLEVVPEHIGQRVGVIRNQVLASEANTTYRPPAAIAGLELCALP